MRCSSCRSVEPAGMAAKPSEAAPLSLAHVDGNVRSNPMRIGDTLNVQISPPHFLNAPNR